MYLKNKQWNDSFKIRISHRQGTPEGRKRFLLAHLGDVGCWRGAAQGAQRLPSRSLEGAFTMKHGGFTKEI